MDNHWMDRLETTVATCWHHAPMRPDHRRPRPMCVGTANQDNKTNFCARSGTVRSGMSRPEIIRIMLNSQNSLHSIPTWYIERSTYRDNIVIISASYLV